MPDAVEARRRLPQVHRLAESLPEDIPAVWRVEAARRAIAGARRVLDQEPERATAILQGLRDAALNMAHGLALPRLHPLINGTGVVLHTNLGRAPLPRSVIDHIGAVAAGYSTLEFDLERGERGSRHVHVEEQLTELTGAEAALAVNNNAAGVLLALSELAAGGEVIVSRGELVEIGGSFRIPDVMRQSGARLVEVGATNKTHRRDYEAALGDATRLLLKVHTSNYRLEGFVESVSAAELAALGHEHGLPVMEDLGSGVLFPLELEGYREPSVREVVAGGVDLVTFSGDKLLGGPQAGLLVGRRDVVARLKRHPLVRALRLDKMTLAGIEATLRLYREGRHEEIPLWHMLLTSPDDLARRATRVARRIARRAGARVQVDVVRERAPVGGGSLPGVLLPTAAVSLREAGGVDKLAERLRRGRPPVVGRVQAGALLLDFRTIRRDEEPGLLDAVLNALGVSPADAEGNGA